MKQTTLFINHEVLANSKPSSIVRACKSFSVKNTKVINKKDITTVMENGISSNTEILGDVVKIYPHKRNNKIVGIKVITEGVPDGYKLELLVTKNLKLNHFTMHYIVGEKTDA